jgi:hypothetical protein
MAGNCADCDKRHLTLQTHSTHQANSKQEADAASQTQATQQTQATHPPHATRQSETLNAPPITDEGLRSHGQPLDANARRLMKAHLGHDFSRVRVHTDGRAAESARAVNATAYTVGQHVVFGAGRYQPQTSAGRRLLAHELTHVVQQASSTTSGGSFNEAASEAEADRNAAALGSSRAASVNLKTSAGAMQRQPEAGEDAKLKNILGAAMRAKAEPDDTTRMMIRGSEITYLLISKYLPNYSGKLSGVGYDAKIKRVEAVKEGKDSIAVTIGKQFILGTNAATIQDRVAEIKGALQSTGVEPTAAAKTNDAATAATPAATTPDAAPAAAVDQTPQMAAPGAWGTEFGGAAPKTNVGETYETYKGHIGDLKATTEGGVKGKVGRGTQAAPSITFEVLKQAFPGMAKDAAANPARETKARAYLDSLNLAFKVMKIDTVEAQANYLSHAYIESDQFRQFTETQGWLNAQKDPKKIIDQKWVDDPAKLRLDTGYLNTTYNTDGPQDKPGDTESVKAKKKEERTTARRRKASVNPHGNFEFIGRGPVQATHIYNYMEVIAMLETAVEHYEAEAKAGNKESQKYAAFAREAANAVKADPQQAANPKYTFLFSAAYMKRRGSDVSVANVGATEEWTGTDSGSGWVAGAKQTQDPQVKALKEKQAAYSKILPLLMCEAKKAGIKVDKKYTC